MKTSLGDIIGSTPLKIGVFDRHSYRLGEIPGFVAILRRTSSEPHSYTILIGASYEREDINEPGEINVLFPESYPRDLATGRYDWTVDHIRKGKFGFQINEDRRLVATSIVPPELVN